MIQLPIQLYFIPFLTACLVSSGFVLLSHFFPKHYLSRSPGGRHRHQASVSRWGGIALVLGFLAAIFSDPNLVIDRPLWGVMAGALAILVFGLWDDWREINWKAQIFFQIILAVSLYFWGIRIGTLSNPFGGAMDVSGSISGMTFMVFWILLVINSINWLDGIDGAAGSVSLVGAGAVFFLALQPEVNQPPMGILAAALGGAILGFLPFNFPPSRIMAGTSGAVFLGFILAILSIFSGAKVATALMVMTLPIIDLLWVIFCRIRSRRSIFSPDESHLHHRLLQLGWSQRKISLAFTLFTLSSAAVAFQVGPLGKLVALGLASVLVIFFRIWVENKLKIQDK